MQTCPLENLFHHVSDAIPMTVAGLYAGAHAYTHALRGLSALTSAILRLSILLFCSE